MDHAAPRMRVFIYELDGERLPAADAASRRALFGAPPSPAGSAITLPTISPGGAAGAARFHLMREVLRLYRTATFSLQPPGDDPARKGIIDSIT